MTLSQPGRGLASERYPESVSEAPSRVVEQQAADGEVKAAGYLSALGGGVGPQRSEGPIDEIPTIFSGEQIVLGGSRTGRVNTPGDADGYAIELVAGQSYLFTLTGTGTSPLEDPLIELYFNGLKVAMDDDAGPGRNAMMRFTATQSGTHYITARAWEPDEGPTLTGEYTLTAALGPAQNPLDALDLGFTRPTTNISVYFATADQTFDGTTAQRSWTGSEIAAAMAAMATFSAVTTLTFTQAVASAGASFILSLASLPDNVLGEFGTVDGTGYGFFDPDPSIWSDALLQPGGLAFSTLLHEIGHGLGLAHPHDNGGVDPNNSSEILQGVVSDFGSYGTFGFNQGVFTIMSYNGGAPSHPFGHSASNIFGRESTPGPLDIALLQQKYGPNTSTNAGDNVYVLPAENVPGTRYQTIWDVGGTDSIVFTGAPLNSVTIDLRAATLVTAPGGAGGLSYAHGLYGGFTIANGVVIEIATSGSGRDTLWGGTGDNILNAGLNDDTLSGGQGFDTLNGDQGEDRVTFEDDPAGVTVNLLLQTATDGWGTTDTLSSIEFVTGSAFNDFINSGAGGETGGTNAVGGAGNDYIESHAVVGANSFGGDGNDTLVMLGPGQAGFYGEGGDDVIVGGNSDDAYLWGEGGDDNIRGGGGADGIRGGIGDDTLFGEAGNDEIEGAEGADVIFGGDGDDRLYGSVDSDVLSGGAGIDVIDGGGGFDTASYDETLLGVVVTLLTADEGEASGADAGVDQLISIENVTGGAGDDVLTGSWLSNVLRGGAGSDQIRGEDGSDQLFGDDGADLLSGGLGDDIIDGGDGVDTASYANALLAVAVNLSIGQDHASGADVGVDQLISIENVTGGAGADRLTGNAQSNTLRGGGGVDLIYGGAGFDQLFGDDGNDALFGGLDADALSGGDGSDELQGEDGNDSLAAGLGDDVLYGGTGNDNLAGDDGADTLYGGDGVDLGYGGAGLDFLLGEAGNDALFGGADADTLIGGDGNDELQGEDGNDRVIAGLGDDVARGGAGNDNLAGNEGADTLYGGDGVDFAYGGAGIDFLLGDAGNDALYGGADGDVLYGYADNDELQGEDGNDRLIGGLGDDLLLGQAGNDNMSGEDGADLLYGGEGDDFGYGGAGIDFVLGDAGNDALYGGADADVLLGGDGRDELQGEDGNDRLIAGLGDDLLQGQAGNDVMSGDDGADTLYGGEGFDLGYGGTGLDILLGEGGNDALFGGADADTLIGGDGNDELQGEDGNDRVIAGLGDDVVRGGLGDDNLAGDDGADTLYGGDGIDLVYGGAGLDFLLGEGGNDALYGGADADTLIGGDGNDELQGEDGNDRVIAGLGDDVVRGGAGNDNLAGNEGADTIYGGDGVDLGYGGAGIDFLLGEGGNDALFGGADADTLIGGDGNDELQGEDGNDRLTGGIGDDLIFGLAGNDFISGDAGVDRLYGGDGADVFSYDSASHGGDFIYEFTSGSDSLRIVAAGFGGGLAGGAAVTLRSGAAPSATGPGGQFLYNTTSGVLSWDSDGAGGVGATVLATLVGAPSLAASDVFVVGPAGAGPTSFGIGPVQEMEVAAAGAASAPEGAKPAAANADAYRSLPVNGATVGEATPLELAEQAGVTAEPDLRQMVIPGIALAETLTLAAFEAPARKTGIAPTDREWFVETGLDTLLPDGSEAQLDPAFTQAGAEPHDLQPPDPLLDGFSSLAADAFRIA